MGSPQEIHLMLCMCLLLKNFLQFLFAQKEFQRFSLDIPHFFLNLTPREFQYSSTNKCSSQYRINSCLFPVQELGFIKSPPQNTLTTTY